MERVKKFAARGDWRVYGTWTTDEDNGGSECISTLSNTSICHLCAHWPGTCNSKACFNQALEHCLPTRRGSNFGYVTIVVHSIFPVRIQLGINLFESVIHRKWVVRVLKSPHALESFL